MRIVEPTKLYYAATFESESLHAEPVARVYCVDAPAIAEGINSKIIQPPVFTALLQINPIVSLWCQSQPSPVKEHIIGGLEARYRFRTWIVEMFAVRPQFRRRGIASEMVYELFRRYPMDGFKTVWFDNPTTNGASFIRHFKAEGLEIRDPLKLG